MKSNPLLLGITSFLLAFCIGMVMTGNWSISEATPMIDHAINRLPLNVTSTLGLRSAEPVVIGSWPPVKGERYPDLLLTDQNGDAFTLSDLKGKVILLELAATPCGGCQAFAGGNEYGVFNGGKVQRDLKSIHHYVKRFAKIDLDRQQDVVLVQLLLYGKGLSNPTQSETTGWAQHFHMDRERGEIVLRGDASMLSQTTRNMIPGFHLVDRDFILRSDSAGHHPVDDLYRDLLPALGQMCR